MGNRRIWWGLGIMAAGLCAAWPFRKQWLEEQDALVAEVLDSPAVVIPPLAPAKLTETRTADLPPVDENPAVDAPLPAFGLHPLTSALERVPAPRSLVKLDRVPQVPALAGDYASIQSQRLDPRSAIVSADSSSEAVQSTTTPPLRRYRIGKHDTLESIAQRLLGSPQHAGKLLAANPDVIRAPEILPVGATIVIPDLTQPSETMVRLPENGM